MRSVLRPSAARFQCWQPAHRLCSTQARPDAGSSRFSSLGHVTSRFQSLRNQQSYTAKANRTGLLNTAAQNPSSWQAALPSALQYAFRHFSTAPGGGRSRGKKKAKSKYFDDVPDPDENDPKTFRKSTFTFDEHDAKEIAPASKEPPMPAAVRNLTLRDVEKDLAEAKGAGPANTWEDRLALLEDALPPALRRGGTNAPGQVLYPATKEDINILINSKQKYPLPKNVEGATIIRLVRLSDPVTSPVSRAVRNMQFGVRGTERWQILGMGIAMVSIIMSLGFWQLDRMKWKRELIEMRRSRLCGPRTRVERSPFPWVDCVDDWVYRIIDVRGVYDHSKEMLVGPRPQTDQYGTAQAGMLVVTPLRLEDGSTILVNRGFMSREELLMRKTEVPGWVRVRGVLEAGEIPHDCHAGVFVKNVPQEKRFLYLIAKDLAEGCGARNFHEASQALCVEKLPQISAYDVMYEESGLMQTQYQMRKKADYLLFWADEHTNFNYAMQWFGIAMFCIAMTFYKFVEVSRWRW